MRIRRVASEKDSGLEKAERSVSSGQGRRWEMPLRKESLRRERNARNAETEMGGCDSVDWTVEIGRTGGPVEDITANLGELENGENVVGVLLL